MFQACRIVFDDRVVVTACRRILFAGRVVVTGCSPIAWVVVTGCGRGRVGRVVMTNIPAASGPSLCERRPKTSAFPPGVRRHPHEQG